MVARSGGSGVLINYYGFDLDIANKLYDKTNSLYGVVMMAHEEKWKILKSWCYFKSALTILRESEELVLNYEVGYETNDYPGII